MKSSSASRDCNTYFCCSFLYSCTNNLSVSCHIMLIFFIAQFIFFSLPGFTSKKKHSKTVKICYMCGHIKLRNNKKKNRDQTLDRGWMVVFNALWFNMLQCPLLIKLTELLFLYEIRSNCLNVLLSRGVIYLFFIIVCCWVLIIIILHQIE